ncbi:MAG TPA: cytochrome c biogenesis protein CcdA [Parvibaculum sp.]|mgnify:CR=1 FL=1|uniref:cytochrome c biogenesis CcdA family protein n=1 Tax=Parvibaculum sp. TaxID=2024848 RepID=UPI002CBD825F|nr:cytochrome c biogenesis protein CcdA [Parvibaculum sp.]HMM14463.1 cytochrome c biogenesis protein CcdA [Parvibaculum sp.]
MTDLSISYFAAAAGGLLSFLSPCVLPLVPAYLCFIAGTSFEELTRENAKGAALGSEGLTRRVALGAVGFVLGFSTVFVALGASASAISPIILSHKDILGRIAGVIIIVFGLHYMGLLRIAFLNREARFQPDQIGDVTKSLWMQFLSPYVIGLAFAFGWTPCIGPILATILAIAASQQSLQAGVLLLATYSLGLGIPFLAAAFAVRGFLAFASRIRRHMRKIEIASGVLLAGTGLLMALGSFEQIAIFLITNFPILGRLG